MYIQYKRLLSKDYCLTGAVQMIVRHARVVTKQTQNSNPAMGLSRMILGMLLPDTLKLVHSRYKWGIVVPGAREPRGTGSSCEKPCRSFELVLLGSVLFDQKVADDRLLMLLLQGSYSWTTTVEDNGQAAGSWKHTAVLLKSTCWPGEHFSSAPQGLGCAECLCGKVSITSCAQTCSKQQTVKM